MKPSTCRDANFAPLLQAFFNERLINQRSASPQTVASYRDAFRLLLRYAERRNGRHPIGLNLRDLDAELVLSFLRHLEVERKNSVASRNARLAALRSFFRYAAMRDPSSVATIQAVLSIPMKRFERTRMCFLTKEEIDLLLSVQDAGTSSGRRDRVMFSTMYNTGARVSEITALRVGDVKLEGQPCISLHGKGRKERSLPLWRQTATELRHWIRRRSSADPSAPLFPNRFGGPMSRSGVNERLQQAVERAAHGGLRLNGRRVSTHTIRHSTAMHLLQAGVDITVIALWLGHESPATTHLYVEADLKMKEKALERVRPPGPKPPRFRPKDKLLAFLEAL
jgi:site-specific recombinase XerD